MFGWICSVPVAPMRKEAAHRSEMVSQLLFGERVQLIESSGDFLFVKNEYDGYAGWCQRSQLTELAIFAESIEPEILTSNYINIGMLREAAIHLPMGVPISNWKGITDIHFTYSGTEHSAGSIPFYESNIVAISTSYVNVPYLWGGKSVFGIDCSGFSQQIFRYFGKQLPRDSGDQAKQGEDVGFLEESRAGDLAFFDNAEGNITHVGILLNNHEIIHASGKVRIDTIDQWGIINRDTEQRTHTLRIIKRYP